MQQPWCSLYCRRTILGLSSSAMQATFDDIYIFLCNTLQVIQRCSMPRLEIVLLTCPTYRSYHCLNLRSCLWTLVFLFLKSRRHGCIILYCYIVDTYMYVEDPCSNVIEKSNSSGTVKGEVKVNKVVGGKLDEGWELDRLELLVHCTLINIKNKFICMWMGHALKVTLLEGCFLTVLIHCDFKD